MDITEAVRPDPQIETYTETERRTAPDRRTDLQIMMDSVRDRVRRYAATPGADVGAYTWGWLMEACTDRRVVRSAGSWEVLSGLALALEQGRRSPC